MIINNLYSKIIVSILIISNESVQFFQKTWRRVKEESQILSRIRNKTARKLCTNSYGSVNANVISGVIQHISC